MHGKSDDKGAEKRRQIRPKSTACSTIQWYEWVIPNSPGLQASQVPEGENPAPRVRVLICCTGRG
jgi:hypothetical protein